jgi:probable FeS assembly SUF system protein SufT
MGQERTLIRDTAATVVPYGDPVIIPAGMLVNITHRLGGNFTVTWEGGMAQIQGRDADALGEEPPTAPARAAAAPHAGGPPDGQALWDALRGVFDPEIPVNIVDLGLVYSLEVEPVEGQPDAWRVTVDMTLTAPGCGMGPVIAQDAKYKIEHVPGVSEADVRIVWDPPWHQDMISETGKMELGLL